MIDWIYYTLAVVALPVGAIAVTKFAGWSLDRDLARSRRERLARLNAG